MAKICCLRPTDDKSRLDATLALARAVGETFSEQFAYSLGSLMGLGMAEYRSGNYPADDEAFLAAAEAGKENAYIIGTSAFYHAMSLFRQGKEVEARRIATEAALRMKPLPADENNPLKGGANHDDLILWMAYKEAKALLKLDAAPAPPTRPNGAIPASAGDYHAEGDADDKDMDAPGRFRPAGARSASSPPARLTGRATGAIWLLEGSSLTVRWPSPRAPGGAWIDRCTLSQDGRSYTGTNQQGVPIRGLIAED